MTSVKYFIHKHCAGMEEARDPEVLHASELLKHPAFCPREKALMVTLGLKPAPSFVGTAQRITYDFGRWAERQIRDVYLASRVVGGWVCHGCGATHDFSHHPNKHCFDCGENDWVYQEPRFTCPETGISGGIDCLVDLGNPKLTVVEIKTIDKDQFKELKAPLAEHKFRTSLYLRLVADGEGPGIDQIDTEVAKVIYMCKGYGIKDPSLKAMGLRDQPFSPFKEYAVKRDDSLAVVPILKAQAYTAWRKDPSKGFPCGVCVNGLTKRASSCMVAPSCFSGKFPGNITWMEHGDPKHLVDYCAE